MKKIFLMMAVVLMSTIGFAQKSNVNKAKNLAASYENPDFDGARDAIQKALEDPTTKDLTNTWFVAGQIGYKEFEYDDVQLSLGQSIDERKRGAAIVESYKYWLVADSLSQIPNEKGKVDAATRKKIVAGMLDYYRRMMLINYGILLQENHEYMKAYDVFMMHLNMPDLPMMQDPKSQAVLVKDSTYYTMLHYAGMFAYNAEEYDLAMSIFRQFENPEVAAVATDDIKMHSMEFVYQIYYNRQDTANYVEALKAGMQKFPKNSFFIQNLINHYIFSQQYEEAVTFLTEAIEKDPTQVQYYVSKGNILAEMRNFDAAFVEFNKAIDIDPTDASIYKWMGFAYYNKAEMRLNEVNQIVDNALYNREIAKQKEMYRDAIAPLEKSFELLPTDLDVANTLKQLYIRYGMTDKLDAINAKISELMK